ncbi:MAG TPA: hypothetical protein VE544_12095 [Nitrososphaeraceae archaeon]|nr:hypothetical protein [Nitrososphaeraceae archaeon]
MNMLLDILTSIIAKMIGITYRWLDDVMITSLFNFIRTFEYVIIICCVVAFLLVTVFLMLRQARKLPRSYIVEVADIYGQKTTPEGLRLVFATYDAAVSYADFYRDIYGEQYKFRVVELKE